MLFRSPCLRETAKIGRYTEKSICRWQKAIVKILHFVGRLCKYSYCTEWNNGCRSVRYGACHLTCPTWNKQRPEIRVWPLLQPSKNKRITITANPEDAIRFQRGTRSLLWTCSNSQGRIGKLVSTLLWNSILFGDIQGRVRILLIYSHAVFVFSVDSTLIKVLYFTGRSPILVGILNFFETSLQIYWRPRR